MKVNVDGMRTSATRAMNTLGNTVESLLDNLPPHLAEGLKEDFNDAARNVDIFNCVYNKDDETFNDISDEVEVRKLD